MKKALFDFKDPFFKPLWIRVLIFAICIGWGLLELSMGANFWGALFIGMGLMAGYHFFMAGNFPGDEAD
ncbi:MAG: DUF3329 domain-containing protein [Pseudomonadota bacterium]